MSKDSAVINKLTNWNNRMIVEHIISSILLKSLPVTDEENEAYRIYIRGLKFR